MIFLKLKPDFGDLNLHLKVKSKLLTLEKSLLKLYKWLLNLMNEAAKTTEIDSFMRERSFRCMQLVKTFNKMYEWLLDEISMTLNKI